MIPRAVIFDLDDTLAESFQPPPPEIIDGLRTLLEKMPVAIMTAAGWPRIENEFVHALQDSEHIGRFYIFPNSSSQCYRYKEGVWTIEYDMQFTEADHQAIHDAITESVKEVGIAEEHPRLQPEIIDRGPQIAYAAIGLNATLDEKKAWDPDQSKRKKLRSALMRRIPQFEVLIGGMTTIDITKKGINKAYGVYWISKHLSLPPGDMLYVGDALYPGGNDEVVKQTGIQTRSTTGPVETEKIIEELLRTMA